MTAGLSHALQKQHHRCDIVTLRDLYATNETAPPTSTWGGLHIYRLPYLGSRRYPLAPAVLNFLAPYDVVHIHALDFFVDFLVLMRSRHHKPLVVNTHGGIFHTRWLWPLKHVWFQTLMRLSLRHTDAVICDSPHDYTLFRDIVPANRLHMVQNGVDVQPFLTIQKEVVPGLIVGIGRIFENKQVERLIDLVGHLAGDVPQVRLVWIGHDQEQRTPALLRRAEELGIRDRVHFTGLASQEEMQQWLSQAQLFVSASSYEAFGVATIEAMSSGTVPVVTPVGVHPDVVRDGENGFLYRFEGTQAADCLRHALRLDPSRIQQMGQKAREASLCYAWESVVHAYLDIYHLVLARRSPGH